MLINKEQSLRSNQNKKTTPETTKHSTQSALGEIFSQVEVVYDRVGQDQEPSGVHHADISATSGPVPVLVRPQRTRILTCAALNGSDRGGGPRW